MVTDNKPVGMGREKAGENSFKEFDLWIKELGICTRIRFTLNKDKSVIMR